MSDASATSTNRVVDPKLLEILVCPVTRGPLVYDREAQELVSEGAGLAYPIRDGIPIMLPEEARQLEQISWRVHGRSNCGFPKPTKHYMSDSMTEIPSRSRSRRSGSKARAPKSRAMDRTRKSP